MCGSTPEHSHEHAAPHRHPHPHPHPVEAHNAGAGQGPVLLDVGGDAGALILLATPDMQHVEIEVSPAGRDGDRTHVAVLARPAGGAQVYAAVYPSLTAGAWTVWHPDPGRSDEPVMQVQVPAGSVAQVQWPSRVPA